MDLRDRFIVNLRLDLLSVHQPQLHAAQYGSATAACATMQHSLKKHGKNANGAPAMMHATLGAGPPGQAIRAGWMASASATSRRRRRPVQDGADSEHAAVKPGVVTMTSSCVGATRPQGGRPVKPSAGAPIAGRDLPRTGLF
jgi:hypothetical protein